MATTAMFDKTADFIVKNQGSVRSFLTGNGVKVPQGAKPGELSKKMYRFAFSGSANAKKTGEFINSRSKSKADGLSALGDWIGGVFNGSMGDQVPDPAIAQQQANIAMINKLTTEDSTQSTVITIVIIVFVIGIALVLYSMLSKKAL